MPQILDGKGDGYKVQVDKDHRMLTKSIIETEEAFIASKDARSYLVSTLVHTLNSTNEHKVLYLRNNSQQYDMRIQTVYLSWNGGSTNHDRVMKWSWYVAPNEPTANHEEALVGNLNFRSNNIANITAYKWDGVGDGITWDNGIIGSEELLGNGHSKIENWGTPIIGFNNAVGLAFTGEEIGDFSATVRFYMKEAIGV